MWKRALLGVGALFVTGLIAVSALVVWASTTAEASMRYPDTPYPDIQASTDPDVIARGRYLVRGPAHCAQCHATPDRDQPERVKTDPLHGGMSFEMGPIGTLYARNLTPDPTTGIGRRTDAELARVLRHGVLPEGDLSIFMRYAAADLSEEDIQAVISYLRSVPPVHNEVPDRHLTFLGKAIVRVAFSATAPRQHQAPTRVSAGDTPSVARGEYLANHVMNCIDCHTQMDPSTFELIGPLGGGGTVEASHGKDHDMEFAPPNLTSHPTGYTGKVDEDTFVARIGAGRVHASSTMPWEGFQMTRENDLRSVYRYLKSLPPVDNETGPPYRPVGWTP